MRERPLGLLISQIVQFLTEFNRAFSRTAEGAWLIVDVARDYSNGPPDRRRGRFGIGRPRGGAE